MKELKLLGNTQLQFVAALALFVVAAYFAGHQTLSQAETAIFNAIYHTPPVLRQLFLVVTQAGSIYVLLGLSAVYFVKRSYHIVIRLLMSGLLAYLMAGVAKDLYGRPRPAELLNDIVVYDFYVRGPGFPSGHVALATAIGLTLGRYLPRKYRWVGPVGILAVAWSRVYLGAHAPLDLVGGFALGWLSVLLFRHVRLSTIRKNPQTNKARSLKKP